MTQNNKPQEGEIYRHYKYNPNGEENNYTYEIIGTCIHTETEDNMVVYKPLYDSSFIKENNVDFFCRPMSMWNDQIDKIEYSGPRFTKLQ